MSVSAFCMLKHIRQRADEGGLSVSMHFDIHCNAYLSHRLCSCSERSDFRFFDATHCDIHCNAYLSHRLCSCSECLDFRLFDATHLALFWGEPWLTTTCPNSRFAIVHGPH